MNDRRLDAVIVDWLGLFLMVSAAIQLAGVWGLIFVVGWRLTSKT